MLRTFLFVILLVSLVPVASAQTPGEGFLPAGTILHCTLDEPNFSSRGDEDERTFPSGPGIGV